MAEALVVISPRLVAAPLCWGRNGVGKTATQRKFSGNPELAAPVKTGEFDC
jgi:hypothetical protein